MTVREGNTGTGTKDPPNSEGPGGRSLRVVSWCVMDRSGPPRWRAAGVRGLAALAGGGRDGRQGAGEDAGEDEEQARGDAARGGRGADRVGRRRGQLLDGAARGRLVRGRRGGRGGLDGEQDLVAHHLSAASANRDVLAGHERVGAVLGDGGVVAGARDEDIL